MVESLTEQMGRRWLERREAAELERIAHPLRDAEWHAGCAAAHERLESLATSRDEQDHHRRNAVRHRWWAAWR